MTNQKRGRDVLPIPDRAYTGLIKYDAKDPEAMFPKMEQLRPPEGQDQRLQTTRRRAANYEGQGLADSHCR